MFIFGTVLSQKGVCVNPTESLTTVNICQLYAITDPPETGYLCGMLAEGFLIWRIQQQKFPAKMPSPEKLTSNTRSMKAQIFVFAIPKDGNLDSVTIKARTHDAVPARADNPTAFDNSETQSVECKVIEFNTSTCDEGKVNEGKEPTVVTKSFTLAELSILFISATRDSNEKSYEPT